MTYRWYVPCIPFLQTPRKDGEVIILCPSLSHDCIRLIYLVLRGKLKQNIGHCVWNVAICILLFILYCYETSLSTWWLFFAFDILVALATKHDRVAVVYTGSLCGRAFYTFWMNIQNIWSHGMWCSWHISIVWCPFRLLQILYYI